MRYAAIILILMLAGCSNCGGNSNPNSANDTATDGGADVGSDDGVGPSPTGLRFDRRVPLQGLVGNRLEDPNFGFQNESWFAVDNSNELQRVRRIYEAQSPENRPIAGIVGGNGTTCLLGRMLWGEGNHSASVFVSVANADANISVNLLGIDPAGPDWTSSALEPIPNSGGFDAYGEERTWTRFETTAPGRYGWGYFEVCAASADTVFVGAPAVSEAGAANTLSSAPHSQAARREQVQRIEAFERWRTR